MAAYVRRVKKATNWLKNFSIIHIPRSENHQADALAKLVSSSADGKPKRIQWETLRKRSIEPREVMWLDWSFTWMDPMKCLANRQHTSFGCQGSRMHKEAGRMVYFI